MGLSWQRAAGTPEPCQHHCHSLWPKHRACGRPGMAAWAGQWASSAAHRRCCQLPAASVELGGTRPVCCWQAAPAATPWQGLSCYDVTSTLLYSPSLNMLLQPGSPAAGNHLRWPPCVTLLSACDSTTLTLPWHAGGSPPRHSDSTRPAGGLVWSARWSCPSKLPAQPVRQGWCHSLQPFTVIGCR